MPAPANQPQGRQATLRRRRRTARFADAQVLPFSTGVILEPLPVDVSSPGCRSRVADLRGDNWHALQMAS